MTNTSIEEKLIEDTTDEIEWRLRNGKNYTLKEILRTAFQTLRESVLQEVEEKIENNRADHVKQGVNKNHSKDEIWACCECYDDGKYNSALDDSLAILRSLKNKKDETTYRCGKCEGAELPDHAIRCHLRDCICEDDNKLTQALCEVHNKK